MRTTGAGNSSQNLKGAGEFPSESFWTLQACFLTSLACRVYILRYLCGRDRLWGDGFSPSTILTASSPEICVGVVPAVVPGTITLFGQYSMVSAPNL
jgi:hypothetical protein